MFVKYIMTGLAGTALLASVAVAQTPTATTDSAKTSTSTASDSSFKGDWRASKLVGNKTTILPLSGRTVARGAAPRRSGMIVDQQRRE